MNFYQFSFFFKIFFRILSIFFSILCYRNQSIEYKNNFNEDKGKDNETFRRLFYMKCNFLVCSSIKVYKNFCKI